uniref:Uncharacterized protein n=1 Tax=Setaria viridis TaxID=4556 RepID=A0A4U6TE89_SETVI|nr:hypothetical protein SEVIR_8G112300v2 [Setaria viridis]
MDTECVVAQGGELHGSSTAAREERGGSEEKAGRRGESGGAVRAVAKGWHCRGGGALGGLRRRLALGGARLGLPICRAGEAEGYRGGWASGRRSGTSGASQLSRQTGGIGWAEQSRGRRKAT